MYNSIKSGIAVDWPSYTGSATPVSVGSRLFLTSIASGSNYRLPFETLYDFSNLPVYNSDSDNNKFFAVVVFCLFDNEIK